MPVRGSGPVVILSVLLEEQGLISSWSCSGRRSVNAKDIGVAEERLVMVEIMYPFFVIVEQIDGNHSAYSPDLPEVRDDRSDP
jgi:hypothetical protein